MRAPALRWPQGEGIPFETLMRNADLALYHAKAHGRGRFSMFDSSMDERAHARRALEIDLRRALVLGEFELHFQPQVELGTGELSGFEALVRWRHPTRGLVSPGEFIPFAEEIGMISALGEWVMREACHAAAGWSQDLVVAVNVSPQQFEQGTRLIEMIQSALAHSLLPGRRLEVEITEGVLMRNDASVLDTLHRLRALGVQVAMDDFGTGYSSLSQLQSFPFDKLKIDRSFLADKTDIATQTAMICAIARLGESLGMSTIAEGIETVEQLERVRAGGCSAVQGYLFSRPVPAADVEGLIGSMTHRRAA